MKRMENTKLVDFMSAFNNKIKYRSGSYTLYEIEFRPECSIYDFKMRHTLKAYRFYSKSKDKTYMFIYDCGFIDFSKIFGTKNVTGTTIVVDGNISFDDFSKSSKYIPLLRDIYYQKEKEISKDTAA